MKLIALVVLTLAVAVISGAWVVMSCNASPPETAEAPRPWDPYEGSSK